MVRGSSKWGISPKVEEWALKRYEAGKSNLTPYQIKTIKRFVVSGKRCDGIISDETNKRSGGTTSNKTSTKSISKIDTTISKKDMTRRKDITDEANIILKKYK